jgi:hypothetical protein
MEIARAAEMRDGWHHDENSCTSALGHMIERVIITKECVLGSEPPRFVHRPKPQIDPTRSTAS